MRKKKFPQEKGREWEIMLWKEEKANLLLGTQDGKVHSVRLNTTSTTSETVRPSKEATSCLGIEVSEITTTKMMMRLVVHLKLATGCALKERDKNRQVNLSSSSWWTRHTQRSADAIGAREQREKHKQSNGSEGFNLGIEFYLWLYYFGSMSWVSFVGLLSGWNLEGILVYLWFKYVCVCVCVWLEWVMMIISYSKITE